MKSDRTKQWIALGRTAPDDVVDPPAGPTDDSWSLLRAGCVAPVVQLIRASHPRVFAVSGPAGDGPGIETWVRASAEHADIVVRFTGTGPSCLAEPRLDEFLPTGPG